MIADSPSDARYQDARQVRLGSTAAFPTNIEYGPLAENLLVVQLRHHDLDFSSRSPDQVGRAKHYRVRARFPSPEGPIFQLTVQPIQRSPCLTRVQTSVPKWRSPEVRRKRPGRERGAASGQHLSPEPKGEDAAIVGLLWPLRRSRRTDSCEALAEGVGFGLGVRRAAADRFRSQAKLLSRLSAVKSSSV